MRHAKETTVQITNEKGLHLHVASLIARAAARFQSDIYFVKDGLRANGKSIMSLTLLAAPVGTSLTLVAEGPDAEDAIEQLEQLFKTGFGAT